MKKKKKKRRSKYVVRDKNVAHKPRFEGRHMKPKRVHVCFDYGEFVFDENKIN